MAFNRGTSGQRGLFWPFSSNKGRQRSMAVLGCEGAASSTSPFPRVDRTYIPCSSLDHPDHSSARLAILPDLALGSLAASARWCLLPTPLAHGKDSASTKQHEKGERHRSQSEIVMGSHGQSWEVLGSLAESSPAPSSVVKAEECLIGQLVPRTAPPDLSAARLIGRAIKSCHPLSRFFHALAIPRSSPGLCSSQATLSVFPLCTPTFFLSRLTPPGAKSAGCSESKQKAHGRQSLSRSPSSNFAVELELQCSSLALLLDLVRLKQTRPPTNAPGAFVSSDYILLALPCPSLPFLLSAFGQCMPTVSQVVQFSQSVPPLSADRLSRKLWREAAQ
ncbi:hypothetical protein E4U36_006429 [Claviceps purpurea]|nr:hypothetical protein E4U36_006429 [Claviceps purpurea]